ncbi:hypothetical protein [Sphingobium sp. Sx8-8]|uniref:hypothetical protein n=1 Tax=Sphingobium sp. Sx8-8 TaxID=2933617 RepID=UPI001F5A8BCC|nr:hypothetical protein [Sphingobium sp. Sx8-8]
MRLENFVTIDFEASCLPRHGRSFPIEVATAGPEGVTSWLVKPVAGHDGWSWTHEAAALHGIDQDRLAREGLPAHRVFAEINAVIAGRQLIADSRIDQYWWSLLAGAAGEDVGAPILYVGTILDKIDLPSEDIFAAQHHADALHPTRHRAADDALWLWTLLCRLKDMAVADAALPAPPRQVPPSIAA